MLEISISQPASHEFAISNEYYLFVLIVKRNMLCFDFPFFINLFFFSHFCALFALLEKLNARAKIFLASECIAQALHPRDNFHA